MDTNFQRLLETLKVIPTKGKLSTTEIQQRLEVRGFKTTSRTIQRDLEQLAAPFGILCDRRAKPYGWSWAGSRRVASAPVMDWPEALSFSLLQEYLSDLLPASVAGDLAPYFAHARDKLSSHFGDVPMRRWPQKVCVVPTNQPLLPPTIKRSVHDAVTEGLLSERQLEVVYRSGATTAVKSHRIHPLGLVQAGAVLYLTARFYEYPEPRTLAMHRIERATLLDDTVHAPEDFTLAKHVEEGAFGFGGNRKIRFRAVWRDHCGDHLLESRLSAKQVAVRRVDGSLQLDADIVWTRRLVWWLLGFGADVTVLKPVGLRREVAQAHAAAARLYGIDQRAVNKKRADACPK